MPYIWPDTCDVWTPIDAIAGNDVPSNTEILSDDGNVWVRTAPARMISTVGTGDGATEDITAIMLLKGFSRITFSVQTVPVQADPAHNPTRVRLYTLDHPYAVDRNTISISGQTPVLDSNVVGDFSTSATPPVRLVTGAGVTSSSSTLISLDLPGSPQVAILTYVYALGETYDCRVTWMAAR